MGAALVAGVTNEFLVGCGDDGDGMTAVYLELSGSYSVFQVEVEVCRGNVKRVYVWSCASGWVLSGLVTAELHGGLLGGFEVCDAGLGS
ncbi:hypothetical protein [Mycobacterium leprae]|nr:hypothetical protein [Mycobacterium leprae]OAR21686.1 hypothetical protein A8144_00260 [Mycobacterium leprae 3125609]OAX72224.1 hypothetical protein A3216_00320 [Mycobacterium leprae 7935681]